MKKFLLFGALALVGTSAFADGFSDIFKLSYEGESLSDGQTITVTEYYDPNIKAHPEFAGLIPPSYKCVAAVKATNLTTESKKLEVSLNVVDPSSEVFNSGKFGYYQLCFSYETAQGMIAGNCLEQKDLTSFNSSADPVKPKETMNMDIDQASFTDLTPVKLKLDMRVMDGSKELGNSTVYIDFTHKTDTTMAVEGIEAETTSQYFNLQGVRISEPQKGQIYIERRGAKVVKRIF